MANKDKIPWYLAWIIGIIIFVTWFFNLDYLWKGKQSADSFMISIKEAISEVLKGFKETGQALQSSDPTDSPLPLDKEKLDKLKEKILQNVQEEITK
ncbi:hypothetical protein MYX06_01230 [Patescibacteria group bacterium AH-259-L05]|nr:hypothetical protein [Patescibacteria group bacterium AH-259-L05]